jgi:phosphate transport system substrate-binding protein
MSRQAWAGALALFLSVILAPPLAADTLTLSGASQLFATIFFPHKAEIEAKTGATLQLRSSRSLDGIRDLVAGKADIAMISNDLPGILAAINAAGLEHIDAKQLVEHQITTTEITFIVNPRNPVSQLKREALAGLLSGRIANWAEVGGIDQPVLVIVAPKGGIYPDIEDAVMRPLGLRWSRDASAMASVVFTTRAVAQTANALSYMGSLASDTKDSGVKVLATDVHIKEPLTLVTLGPASSAAQRVIEAARDIAKP